MGAYLAQSESPDMTLHVPPLQQYVLKNSGPNYYVWDHIYLRESLIEFPINVTEKSLLANFIDIYLMRHRHHLLVSSLYFRQEPYNQKIRVFYERVFTNLSRIKDIPFRDSLQFYYVAFKGFKILFDKFGYFCVTQSMFHLTQNHKIKVWCDGDINSFSPSAESGTEEMMVKKIIRIIDENTDPSTHTFPLGSIIYEEGSQSFSQASTKLRQLCMRQGWIIPEKLQCLDLICNGEVQSILDEYQGLRNQEIYSPKKIQQKEIREMLPRDESKVVNVEKLQQPVSNRKSRGLQLSFSYDNSIKSLKSRSYDNCASRQANSNSIIKVSQPSRNSPLHSPVNNVFHPSLLPKPSSVIKFSNYLPPKPASAIPANANVSRNFQNATPNNRARGWVVKQESASRSSFNRTSSMEQLRSKPLNLQSSNPTSQQYRVVINYSPQNKNVNAQTLNNFQASSLQSNISKTFTLPSPQNQLHSQLHGNRISKNHSPPHLSSFSSHPFPPPSTFLHAPLSNASPSYSFATNEHSSKRKQQGLIDQNIKFKPAHSSYQNEPVKQALISTLKKIEDSNKQNLSVKRGDSDYKSKFEDFKKSFKYEKREHGEKSEDNLFTKPEFWEELSKSIHRSEQPRNELMTTASSGKKPFAELKTKPESMSYHLPETPGIKKQHPRKIESYNYNFNSKFKFTETSPQFPTVTDISDNISFIPNHESSWKEEESMVIKHDPNATEIRMPVQKKYLPNIDEDIWSDMLKMKEKRQSELK